MKLIWPSTEEPCPECWQMLEGVCLNHNCVPRRQFVHQTPESLWNPRNSGELYHWMNDKVPRAQKKPNRSQLTGGPSGEHTDAGAQFGNTRRGSHWGIICPVWWRYVDERDRHLLPSQYEPSEAPVGVLSTVSFYCNNKKIIITTIMFLTGWLLF